MALSDTGQAIATVSELLQTHLGMVTSNVTIGRPEEMASTSTPTLNLFLYEIQFDQGLRQVALDEGQPVPLWLVLKYLLTAFDGVAGSDTIAAQRLLGQGMQALYELSLTSIKKVAIALQENPEELKLKFDDTPSDLLAKIMQGSDEKYRCSVSFEVRPVMIATTQSSSYSLLVGVDYQEGGIVRADQGIPQIPVVSFLAPVITAITPEAFEANPDENITTLTLYGSHLNLANLSVYLGPVPLPIVAQRADTLQCQVPSQIRNGQEISAGSYPLSVVQNLPSGRHRSSNLLVAHLLPILVKAEPIAHTIQQFNLSEANPKVFGSVRLWGRLLGTEKDDILVALSLNGMTEQAFEAVSDLDDDDVTSDEDPDSRQTCITFSIPEHKAVPPGAYRIILRVNGQQARNSPEILLGVRL
jgi:hypothetical protein